MKVVQRDHKLDSYTPTPYLNTSSEIRKMILPRRHIQTKKGATLTEPQLQKYCIQDCALCNFLCEKLSTVAGSFGMAEVCSVPTSWIFMRGQGAKIPSLVSVAYARQLRHPSAGGSDQEREIRRGVRSGSATGVYMEDPSSAGLLRFTLPSSPPTCPTIRSAAR
jgi:hypothetical protein